MYPVLLVKLLIRMGLATLLPGVRREVDRDEAGLRYYSNRLLGSPWLEADRLALGMREYAPEVVDLSQGAPRFDLLPSASTKLPADRRGWPPAGGWPELRQAVAGLLAEQGLTFHPHNEVLITAGVLGAAGVVMDAFINRGDRVVLFDPGSPLYPLVIRARRARLVWLPSGFEQGRTRFRLEQLARSLHGARLLVLCSPANPSGTILAPEDLEQIAWWARRQDVLLLDDQSFERYRPAGERLSIGALPDARDRTLTVGSVSKGHALAAARVGWLAGCRSLMRPCLATAYLRCPFVPTLSQQVALSALQAPPQAFDLIRADLERRRHYVHERLTLMGLTPVWPAGGFFFWVPIGPLGRTGRQVAEQLLGEVQVAVTPGELFGPSGAGHIRLSYVGDEGRLQEGLDRLAQWIGRDRQTEKAPTAA
jgi:aspartate/methionine/tyrosine aminotransferase